MGEMKKIAYLYRQDWRRIFKNPVATFLIIALMIIPSLYAWFNIKALWDPYGNTSELPIAVYSDDSGATFNDQQVEIGEELLANLHENKQLGWRFVDSKKALDQGVKSGKYYAGIYIPKDFSKDLLSFTTGEIQKPKIEYSVNEKINAIAPKITDKGATSLQEEISKEFINTASQTLMTVFNEVGYNIDENLVSINRLKNLILTTDAQLETINQYTEEVVALQAKVPDLKEKLAQADEFVAYLPEVDQLTTKVVTLNQDLPTIKAKAALILTLQAKIPEIENAGKQVAMVDEDFDELADTLNQSISTAKQALIIVQQVETLLPEMNQLTNQADAFASTIKDAAENLSQATDGIVDTVSLTLQSIRLLLTDVANLSQQINAVLADNQLTPEERATLKEVLAKMETSLTNQQQMLTQLIDFLSELENQTGSQALQGTLEHLRRLQSLLQKLTEGLSQVDIDQISTGELQQFLTDVTEFSQQANQELAGVDVQQVGSTVKELLQQLIATITTAQGLISQAQAIDFDALLQATEKTLTNGVTILEKYQQELPALKQEIHDANTILNGHMPEIIAGINAGSDLYQNQLPIIEKKLASATDFINNDWPDLEAEITTTLQTADDKMPQLETALKTASQLITNDWPTIENGIHQAAGAIKKGEETVDLGEVIKLLKLDATKESDFFTSPVEVQENRVFPIANNGSASTPFYTALCLWVGAVLLSSVATTEVYLEEKDRGRFTKQEEYIARGLTFLTVSVVQTLIVTLGNIFLLGVDVRNPVFSIIFALIVGLTFMMMVYVLMSIFGTIGKGIAIIILVLSISGGGGNYPIQVSGPFFQMVSPLLPFTHAVNLLRESAGGIYWPNAFQDILIFVGIFTGFFVIGLWGRPYVEGVLKKFDDLAHDSKFFH